MAAGFVRAAGADQLDGGPAALAELSCGCAERERRCSLSFSDGATPATSGGRWRRLGRGGEVCIWESRRRSGASRELLRGLSGEVSESEKPTAVLRRPRGGNGWRRYRREKKERDVDFGIRV